MYTFVIQCIIKYCFYVHIKECINDVKRYGNFTKVPLFNDRVMQLTCNLKQLFYVKMTFILLSASGSFVNELERELWSILLCIIFFER